MEIKELAVLGREKQYKVIIDIYENDKTLLEECSKALFVAESYEEIGKLDKAAEVYEYILKEYEEEIAADHLVKIYKVLDNAEALKKLVISLEDNGVSDSSLLMANYEILRIEGAQREKQLEALIEFVDTYYDDIYGVLLIEELLQQEDIDKAKRYISKFKRRYNNSEYDTYVQELEVIAEGGKYTKPDNTIRNIIYLRENSQSIENGNDASTRIKTKGLSELLSGHMLDGMVAKQDERNSNPPTVEERFSNIVGMNFARNEISRVYRVYKLQMERENADFNAAILGSTHFTICGKRGSGKTLLAETIGQILADFGIRGAKEPVSVDAKDFCDSIDNASSLKDVTLIIENIDRCMDEQGKFNDFAWRIRKFLKEKQDTISVILTGTKEAMSSLFLEEKEIQELIYSEFYIEDYNLDELMDIMRLMVKHAGWKMTEDAEKQARKQLAQEMKMLNFANGKAISEKIKTAQKKAADRVDLLEDIDEQDMVYLEAEDFAKEGMNASVPELLQKLEAMIGLESVKEQVHMLVNKLIIEKEAEKAGSERKSTVEGLHMVFKGSPGTGKTTVARVIGEIYQALGILPGNKEGFIECGSPDLVGQYVGETAQKTRNIIERAMGGVLFIDEAYSLTNNQFGKEAIDTLITTMENSRESIMIIFAGYSDDMEKFLDVNAGLRSRIPNHITFEDYKEEEMVAIFKSMVTSNRRYLDKDTNELIVRLIRQGSKTRDFGNARGVRGLVALVENAQDQRIFQMVKDGIVPSSNDYEIIRKEDIEVVLNQGKMDGSDEEETVEELLQELENMIGLQAVKNAVNTIVDEARYNKWAESKGMLDEVSHGSLHLLFKGNAGTGKTTVARMLGKIYYKLGVLKTGQCVECSRAELVAGYVGQTATKTQEYIDKARGGILFVDEAYALNQGGENDFGTEALTTIMTAMENCRDELMVIFAGYAKELDELIATNQGLESRFPKQNEIIFEDYTDDELLKIFIYQATKNGMFVGEEIHPVILEKIKTVKANTLNFGNARDIRNIVESVNKARKSRIMGQVKQNKDISSEYAKTLVKEDFK